MTTFPACPSCHLPKHGIKKDKDGDPVRVCGNRRCPLFLKTETRKPFVDPADAPKGFKVKRRGKRHQW